MDTFGLAAKTVIVSVPGKQTNTQENAHPSLVPYLLCLALSVPQKLEPSQLTHSHNLSF